MAAMCSLAKSYLSCLRTCMMPIGQRSQLAKLGLRSFKTPPLKCWHWTYTNLRVRSPCLPSSQSLGSDSKREKGQWPGYITNELVVTCWSAYESPAQRPPNSSRAGQGGSQGGIWVSSGRVSRYFWGVGGGGKGLTPASGTGVLDGGWWGFFPRAVGIGTEP